MTAPTLPGMPQLRDVTPAITDSDERSTARTAGPIRAMRADDTGAVWLILNLCRACNPRTGRYCTAHDSSRKFR